MNTAIIIFFVLLGMTISILQAKKDSVNNVVKKYDYLDYIFYLTCGFMIGFVIGFIFLIIINGLF